MVDLGYAMNMGRERKAMNIVVCVKQVIEPELPLSKFRVDLKAKKVIPPEGIPPVINPYDAQAVEVGLRLKECHGGRVTVLSVGDGDNIDTLRYTLAMGVDEAILITVKHTEDIDGFYNAYILSQGIKKVGDYDLILCGREAADWDKGITGSIIAENLGANLVTLAKSVEAIDGKVKVERITKDGYQVFESSLPAIITISGEVGKPRIPSGYGIIAAARKQIVSWNESHLEVDQQNMERMIARSELVNLFIPKYERKCEIIEGKDVAETSTKLAMKLRDILGM